MSFVTRFRATWRLAGCWLLGMTLMGCGGGETTSPAVVPSPVATDGARIPVATVGRSKSPAPKAKVEPAKPSNEELAAAEAAAAKVLRDLGAAVQADAD